MWLTRWIRGWRRARARKKIQREMIRLGFPMDGVSDRGPEQGTSEVVRLAASFGVTAREFADVVRQSVAELNALMAGIQEEYRHTGAAYGDDPEGVVRWFREVGEAGRLGEMVRSIRRRHEMLSSFGPFTRDQVQTLMELARQGDEVVFKDLAHCLGVRRERLDNMWVGTVKRLVKRMPVQS